MSRRVSLEVLKSVRIAAPCLMSWDDMTPVHGTDGRVRHCDACRLNVHNISGMSAGEAAELLGRGDDLCVRMYQREDGTVLTQDCPVGLAGLRQKARRWVASGSAAVVASLLTFVGLFGEGRKSWLPGMSSMSSMSGELRESRLREVEPFRTVAERISPTPPAALTPVTQQRFIMGKVCVPPGK